MTDHLVVIGAMKAGTTTFWRDMARHSDVRVLDKELGLLRRHDTSDLGGRQRYLSELGRSSETLWTCEVDTTYSMAPHQSTVAERLKHAKPNARIVYLLRDPIERIISHHHHEVSAGIVSEDIAASVALDARFLDYSRYGAQLAVWREHFPVDQIRLVKFENYTHDRAQVTAELFGWLGLDANRVESEPGPIQNSGETTSRSTGLLRRVLHSEGYRRNVRPMIPAALRGKLATRVLPSPAARPDAPTKETILQWVEQLQPEVDKLRQFDPSSSWWDLERHLEHLAAPEPGCGGSGQ